MRGGVDLRVIGQLMFYRFVVVWLWVLAFAVLGPVAAPRFLASEAQAQVISRIVVEGNQRIEPDTVISYMQIGPGDYYDPERIDESVKALFQTGLFSDVKIFLRGTQIVVVVDENPLINQVNFEGNSAIKDKDLAKEVELRERTVLTRARVQSDIQRIIAGQVIIRPASSPRSSDCRKIASIWFSRSMRARKHWSLRSPSSATSRSATATCKRS
jgi:hypothetical protein